MVVSQVRVGEVLELQRRKVALDTSEEYVEVGLRSFGKGLFHKPAATGAELGTKKVYRVEPGDLVISNVFAWEGALAVASESEQGLIGSHRFMTWIPREDDRVDVRYLLHYFLSEPGLLHIRRASPGSAGRNRTLGIASFEELRIPLPRLSEQRRIASRLDRIAAAALAVSDRNMATYTSALSAVDSTVETLQRGAGPEVPLDKVADVNPGRVRVEDERVAFVPMAAVDEITGTVSDPQVRSAEDTRTGYTQFRRGDVIFARITPCMQNGKSAVFDEPGLEFGYGSTEFHVVRPRREGPNAHWLHAVFRSRWFKNAARERFSGTAGQQRVSAAALKGLQIPVPSEEGATEVLRQLARLETLRQSLRSLTVQRRTVAAALLPAARNEAFAKLRERSAKASR